MGKWEPGATLQVNGNTVPVDANGNFSTLIVLQGGNNLVTLTATDIAGNATTIQRTVHYATGNAPAEKPACQCLYPARNAPRPHARAGTDWDWRVGVGFLIFGKVRSPIAFDITADYPTFYPNRTSDQRLLVLRLKPSRGRE